ncbi:kinase-like domain-containing protein [Gigaspora rosea]|uniref:Kinase-like domain-containing protein n=1 Tax=Gigaspora rosea TaxID=44941 RepID=A0A397ULT2_9GLOM|nr:kinase-like domain-containing protein [Gigaspora rosea]
MSGSSKALEWLKSAVSEKLINSFDYKEFKYNEKISESRTSSIFRSEWANCGLTVALKSLKFDTEGMDMKSFVKELQLLQRVSFHPSICHFFGVTQDSSNERYMMVLQFAKDGNLREYLHINFKTLQWKDKCRIAGEIAQGLAFLHHNQIIHRNLHPKNILVHENKIMITDFALSKFMNPDSSSSNSTNEGMPSFMEPQCFKDSMYKRTTKSDIYSYGVILWEISSGHKPFPSLKRVQIPIKIYLGAREKPIEGTPSGYVEFYKRCWDDEPDNRPEIKEALELFDDYIIKPTNPHITMEEPSEGLLEKAISEGDIQFHDYDQFSDHAKIVEGTFSSIYKSKWKSCGLEVALKCLKVNNRFLDEKIVKELKLLQKTDFHPNIIKFYGVTRDPSSEYYSLVLQFIDGGNLHDYLSKNNSELKWPKKLHMAVEIAKGIKYLHDNGITHHDLHTRNILVFGETILIAGFGIPEYATKASFSTSIVRGMPAYIEPQCFKDPSYKSDFKSDIYSLGVILWEISSCRPPFETINDGYAITIHVYQGGRENPVQGTPLEYEKLYKECWDDDPEKRPSAKLVIERLSQLI